MSNSDIPNEAELVSAYLDGEVTSEERALVESNPNLLRQVEEFKLLSNHVRQIHLNNTEEKETHIFSAIQESKKLLAKDSKTAKNVLPLQKTKRSSRRRPSRTMVLSSVAAAVLAFFAIPLFSSSTQDGDTFITAANIASDSERSEPQVAEESTELTEPAEVVIGSDSTNADASPESAPSEAQGEMVPDDSISTNEEKIEPTEVEEINEDNSSDMTEQGLFSLPSTPFSTETITTYGTESAGVNSLLLADARIEVAEGFDSFIIELSVPEDINTSSPDQIIPGSYAVQLNGDFGISNEESFLLPEEITNYLVVNLAAHGIIWIDDDPGYELTWSPNSEVIEEENSNLLAFYRGDFEGNLTFIVGMNSVRPFRTSLESNPPRLIIEIQQTD
jgi:hypothetical protein